MSKYVYPAIFTKEDNGMYSVQFPDIAGCYTDGESLADALEMAQDALCLMMYSREEEGKNVPISSDIKTIAVNANEFVSLVSCDTLEYRKKYNNSAVKKTLTIPAWLNTIAENEGVNFSQVLQDALKTRLHVS